MKSIKIIMVLLLGGLIFSTQAQEANGGKASSAAFGSGQKTQQSQEQTKITNQKIAEEKAAWAAKAKANSQAARPVATTNKPAASTLGPGIKKTSPNEGAKTHANTVAKPAAQPSTPAKPSGK